MNKDYNVLYYKLVCDLFLSMRLDIYILSPRLINNLNTFMTVFDTKTNKFNLYAFNY